MTEIDNAVNRHDAGQLVAYLVEHMRGAARHDCDAREVLFMLGFRNRQAFNIVATTGEKTDHAGKDARFVVNEDGKRVRFRHLRFGSDEIGRSGS